LYKKIKRLYYRKLKYTHVYAEQGKREKDRELSSVLRDFSHEEYNQASEFLYILDENNIKTNIVFRVLFEINSVWTGIFSRFLGQRVMLKYNTHLEKRSIHQLQEINDLPDEIMQIINVIIEEEESHLKYFKG
jgi:hypothetical protein